MLSEKVALNLSVAKMKIQFDKIIKPKFYVKNPIVAELMISIVVVFLGRFFLYNEMGLAKILYGF